MMLKLSVLHAHVTIEFLSIYHFVSVRIFSLSPSRILKAHTSVHSQHPEDRTSERRQQVRDERSKDNGSIRDN